MRRSLALSAVDMLFILVLGIRAVVYQDVLLHGDGDLASHIALGGRMLDDRALPAHEPLTFTMGDRPFVAHSWLATVAFALVHRVGGFPAVTVFATSVLACAYAAVALFLRRRGLDGRIVLAGGFTAVLLGTLHWLARPHIFTVLFAALLLYLLEADRPRLWKYAALFGIWTNFHGGFVLGLVLIAAYLSGAAIEAAVSRDPAWRHRARHLLAALGVAAIASCLNPYGPAIFADIAASLNSDVSMALIDEYRSPDFHDPSAWLLLLAVNATIVVLALVRPRPSLPRLFAIVVSLTATLYAVRNVDVFSVTAWPLVWLLASRLPVRRSSGYWLGDDFARVEREAVPGPWIVVASLLMLLLVANGGRLAGYQVLRNALSPSRFPVEAVQTARAAGVQGRLFNHYTWGGYAALAWPEQKVFITGLKYDSDVARAYVTIASVFPGWQRELESWGITHVLVPTRSPLVSALTQRKEWCVFHHDSTGTLLIRTTTAQASLCVRRQ